MVPGPLDQTTGGYIYDRRIVEGLRRCGHRVTVHELPGRFPIPDSESDAAAAEAAGCFEPQSLVVIDGLAMPAFRSFLPSLTHRLSVIALVHHPLALETGLSDADRTWLDTCERACLKAASRVVVTSAHTRDAVIALGVPGERAAVVRPGVDPAPRSRGSAGAGVALLCVATVTRRKGHGVLIDALARLRDRPWTLACLGSTSREPDTAASLRERCLAAGLADRIAFLGACDDRRLAEAYDAADLFVLASFHEGYGMALAEALVRGLPIVATGAGAVPDTVPPDCGMLVPPGEVGALADALEQMIVEEGLRARAAEAAYRAGQALPRWADAVAAFEGALAAPPAA